MIHEYAHQSRLRPVFAKESHNYLSSTKEAGQPFCGNAEGWGPISNIRYDLTPCFLDVWISVVAVYGILFGSVALYYLIRKSKPQPVSKNWHFYAKLVGFSTTGGRTIS